MPELNQHVRTFALVGPLVAFFALASFIGYEDKQQPGGVDGAAYFYLVIARLAAMGLVIGVFFRQYLRDFPWRIDRWGWIAGIIGAVVWIALCELSLEQRLLNLLGLSPDLLGARTAVNPGEVYSDATNRAWFYLARFTLLVVAVPIAEELFLRGFFMRFVDVTNWQEISLTEIGQAGLVCGTLYGVLSHPSEALAAAVWFSMVTWLMVRTGKFWNCVVAHAVTNLLLGIYICATGNWELW